MPRTVLVCQHQTCPQQGSAAILNAFQAQAPPDTDIKASGCLSECGSGPMMLILPDATWYAHVTLNDVPTIVDQHLHHDTPVRAKLYSKYHSTPRSPRLLLILTGTTLAAIALLAGFVAHYLRVHPSPRF